ncbi:Endonuclease V [Klebsormidium nitens]|uniref:Endonuclease V n=1 Tax=Klebsormidium nitens TaxID=105231 RepID=A0A1Y1I408_KLENI|nr:Endonuclease V [Klebsormidium nitens]|eukprot:GAQ85670.1 Endonuclease V [Klebsormidium nitens]
MMEGAEVAEQKRIWEEKQATLRSQLITHDVHTWTVPGGPVCPLQGPPGNELRFVGGVDVSFSQTDPDLACAALVVIDLTKLQEPVPGSAKFSDTGGDAVVYERCELVRLDVPYLPGFLGFREVPVLRPLLEEVAQERPDIAPQVILVDGNGILHPRGFGSACHLGVACHMATIGVGKNFFHLDGLTSDGVRARAEARGLQPGEAMDIVGESGRVWGAAYRTHAGSTKPIFVSVGHLLSLDTAVKIVRACCRFRVPEPVRQADMRSRERLRQHDVRAAATSG